MRKLDRPQHLLLATLRNEANGLVEWLSHHLALGFDQITLFTNDCDDGTDLLVQLAAHVAPIAWHDNPGPYEAQGSIQKTALALATAMTEVRRAQWVLHIDADEYVNVTLGNRGIADLTAAHPDAHAIALQWRHFGDAGLERWAGGSMIETFCRAEAAPAVPGGPGIVGFKTLFRPKRFLAFGVHAPHGTWRKRTPVIVNAAGTPMPTQGINLPRGSGYAVGPEQCSWDGALLHHHHVRSPDLHQGKIARGDANGRNNAKRHFGSDFYRAVNCNDVEDRSLDHYRDARLAWEARIRAVPGVCQIEDAAYARLSALSVTTST
jgi:hypothetical protein